MPESSLISYLIVGFLGAILGSFLLHEYDNYGKTNNRFKLRSRCDHCGEQLKFKNLIPILSFLMQKGKSTCCNKKLSYKYLISEIGLASFFMVCLYFDNLTTVGLLFPALLLVALIDEKFKEIPLVLNIYVLLWISLNSNIGENLMASALVGLFLLSLYCGYLFLRKTEGIGLGDVILLTSISLYYGLPEIFYLITISACLLLLKIIISQKYKEQHAFGSWIVLTFGAFILFQEFYVFVG
jgi:prepilin signal peptidase PulO-like enzyme (type II secretory pathway)